MGTVFGIAGIVLAVFVGPGVAETDRLAVGVLLIAAGVLLMALGAAWRRIVESIKHWRWFHGIQRRTASSRIAIMRCRRRRRTGRKRA